MKPWDNCAATHIIHMWWDLRQTHHLQHVDQETTCTCQHCGAGHAAGTAGSRTAWNAIFHKASLGRLLEFDHGCFEPEIFPGTSHGNMSQTHWLLNFVMSKIHAMKKSMSFFQAWTYIDLYWSTNQQQDTAIPPCGDSGDGALRIRQRTREAHCRVQSWPHHAASSA